MKITHKGKEYELNLDKAIEDGLLKPVSTYRVGELYESRIFGLYMLTMVDPIITSNCRKRVALICITGAPQQAVGIRFCPPIAVSDCMSITEEEWVKITDGRTFDHVKGKLHLQRDDTI